MTVLSGTTAGLTRRIPYPSLTRDRLLRRGSVLTASSAITSLVGLAYWSVAAHSYSPSEVGRNSAAISSMMFIGGVAQLNLISALVRFLPVTGRSTMSFVRTVYLAAVGVSLVLSTGFLIVTNWLVPSLNILSTPATAAWFVVSTVLWTIFVLQDSVLTGLNRTWLVPAENTVYAVVKLVLLLALAALLPSVGIFVSWTVALVAIVVPLSIFLFVRAIPSHQRNADAGVTPPTAAEIRRFATADYGGALCWMAAINLLPLLVLDIAGPGATGLLSVSWVIAYSLYLVSGNMGISLVVESAAADGRLAERYNRVIVQTMKIVVPVVAVLVATAPVLLEAFGPAYSSQSTTALRLLVLSAIPNIVTATAVSVMRARNKTALGTVTLAVLCAMVFVLSALLVPRIGITGIGVAWLASQTLMAAVLLATSSSWLYATRSFAPTLLTLPRALRSRFAVGSLSMAGSGKAGRLVSQALPGALAEVTPIEGVPHPASWTDSRPIVSFSDVAVASIGPEQAAPAAVLKVSTSARATEDLRSNVQVLTELHNDARLAGWVDVLPTVLAKDLDGPSPYVLERHAGGVDSRTLAWEDAAVARRALTAASKVISELGNRCARESVLDDDWLRVWVDAPATRVASVLRPNGWRAANLDRLSSEIRNDLFGRPARLGWSHGDFTPGNLLMTPDGARVLGVVDWGSGSPIGIGSLDLGLLILSTRTRNQRRELGDVVVDLVRGASLDADEQDMLTAGVPGASPRTMLLLCWLNHVSDNLRKSDFYRHHLVWRARNIDPVLRSAGAR